MEPIRKHVGKIAILNQDNIDTDRIMPARFLTRIERSGYGELLFHDVRGADFVLDQPNASGVSILVVGTNFGCGSSREHAVWGLQQAGFKAIISRRDESSPGYSDIFRQNSANCGLLLVELMPVDHRKLTALNTGDSIELNLEDQTITVGNGVISFDINKVTKENLLDGKDLIGTTLAHNSAISEFESKMNTYVPKSEALS